MKLGWHILLILLLVLGSWTISYFAPKGIRTLMTVYAEQKKLKEEIRHLKVELNGLEYKLKLMNSRPEYQERIVRLETGYLADKELLIEWLKPE